MHHLRDTQKADLAHVRTVRYKQRIRPLLIDPMTLRHLEVVEGADGSRAGSLLARARSHDHADGRPHAPRVAASPARAIEPIRDRLDAVEEFAFRTTDRGKFRDL